VATSPVRADAWFHGELPRLNAARAERTGTGHPRRRPRTAGRRLRPGDVRRGRQVRQVRGE